MNVEYPVTAICEDLPARIFRPSSCSLSRLHSSSTYNISTSQCCFCQGFFFNNAHTRNLAILVSLISPNPSNLSNSLLTVAALQVASSLHLCGNHLWQHCFQWFAAVYVNEYRYRHLFADLIYCANRSALPASYKPNLIGLWVDKSVGQAGWIIHIVSCFQHFWVFTAH